MTSQATTASDPAALSALWSPVTVGRLTLGHRLAMAPMTRSRADRDGVPSPMAATYYAQRASLGLLITEGTQPSADGQGYLNTPGVYTPEQIAGWSRVADAVHAAGGGLVVQLMHVGRVSHPSNTPHGRQAVAPSAVAADAKMFTADGLLDLPVPRALETDELPTIVEEFVTAARGAVAAGADGVEIHGANGYLLHQFLAANANHRSDAYGGSVQKRIRLPLEVAIAVAEAIGADRVGFRISPANPLNGIDEPDAADVYPALVDALDPLGLAYLHIASTGEQDGLLRELRSRWSGPLLLNRGGAGLATRAADISDGLADVVTLGAAALANPDLIARLHNGDPLTEPDRATMYGGDAHGYIDYPLADGSRPSDVDA